MAALADITLAGLSPVSCLFKASHVDRNQVGVCIFRPSSSEVSAVPLTFQNQIVTNGLTKARSIKSRMKVSYPRVATDPVLGEISLDVAYAETIFTFPVSWTEAQKAHVVKIHNSATANVTIVNCMTGVDKPY